jgi:hypothetical protein
VDENMLLEVDVAEGDWGGASTEDLEVVFRSAASVLALATHQGERFRIRLEPTEAPDGIPVTLFQRNAAGQLVVRTGVRGNLWAKLAFQVGHEFCHVLAGPETCVQDRYFWIEEALCEAASLFVLRGLTKSWSESPPFPWWREYAVEFVNYADQRMREPKHTLPANEVWRRWLLARRSRWEADPYRREDLVILAKRLLPMFETDGSNWHDLELFTVCRADRYQDITSSSMTGHARRVAATRLR